MNDRPRIYLSGPISGRSPGDCRRRFGDRERYWRAMGFDVVNPTRLLPGRWPWLYRLLEVILGRSRAYRLTLRRDLHALSRCDAICKMDGWLGSRGCRLESRMARRWWIHSLHV